MIIFVITEPKLTDLLLKFKKVAEWNKVCPFLLEDDNGHKTREIEKNHKYVDDMRQEMLQQFLNKANPTWGDVVSALRLANYENLAREIEDELKK